MKGVTVDLRKLGAMNWWMVAEGKLWRKVLEETEARTLMVLMIMMKMMIICRRLMWVGYLTRIG